MVMVGTTSLEMEVDVARDLKSLAGAMVKRSQELKAEGTETQVKAKDRVNGETKDSCNH